MNYYYYYRSKLVVPVVLLLVALGTAWIWNIWRIAQDETIWGVHHHDKHEHEHELAMAMIYPSKSLLSGGNIHLQKNNATESPLLEASTSTGSEQDAIQVQESPQNKNSTPTSTSTSTTATTATATSPTATATTIWTSTKPWPNLTTFAYAKCNIISGYRNQMMAFTMLVLRAKKGGHGQLLMESVRHKDTYGTNEFLPFDYYWDVDHWNHHYPSVPRMVDYDPILHSQWTHEKGGFHKLEEDNITTPTKPYGFMGKVTALMAGYERYAKGLGKYTYHGHRDPAEIAMFQGALKPHPDLQIIIDRASKRLGDNYMTLHARIEPDMQRHGVCKKYKVTNLTDILQFIYHTFPEPPEHISTVFMPINRKLLEKEGTTHPHPDDNSISFEKDPDNNNNNNTNKKKTINWLAVENLQVLNRLVEQGMWDGRVQVLEFGSNAVQGSKYEKHFSTAGAILDFFLAINAKVFIGTEVSSYSHDLLATRFFRTHTSSSISTQTTNPTHNYHYRPDGLHDWTPPGTVDPPGFRC
jgi:hypothetical protein